MMQIVVRLILIYLYTKSPSAYSEHFVSSSFCDGNIIVTGSNALKLSQNETSLLCGDGDTEGWRRVPLNQASLFLKRFLNNRGYFNPQIEIAGEQIKAKTGMVSRVTEIYLNSPPIEIPVDKYWPIIGDEMTSSALDAFEKWLKDYLSRNGYICLKTNIVSNPDTGRIDVSFEDANRYRFPEVSIDPVEGMHLNVPKRYHALEPGDWYDSMKMELSTRRIINDEVVINSYFLTNCPHLRSPLNVRQRVVAGEPRLLTFRVGFDSEEFLMTKARWKHSRLGSMASAVQADAHASYVLQKVELLHDWYYLPMASRHHWRSEISGSREFEKNYEIASFQTSSGPAWNYDYSAGSAQLHLGAVGRHIETRKGTGPATTDLGLLQMRISTQTHEYEYFLLSPRTGHRIDLEVQRAWSGFGAPLNLTHVTASGTKLWNILSFQPPIWVLGVRASASSTLIGSEDDLTKLPNWFSTYLGGSRDLRGFPRRSIPNTNQGALTSLYTGAEIRIREVIPYGIQPLVFLDFGKIGYYSPALNAENYWSPGFGVNVQSGIGSLRFTLARGIIQDSTEESSDSSQRWQFYFGFGEQF